MKQCPVYGTECPNEQTMCSMDGSVPLEVRESATGTVIRKPIPHLGQHGRRV